MNRPKSATRSHVAALRSQHATAERNWAIVEHLDDVIDAVQRPAPAPIRQTR
jgi:hypothetical protein